VPKLQRRIVPLQFCCLCVSALACLALAGRAHALPVAYYFEGTNTLSAIDGVPIGNFDTFIGYLSYDTDAQLVSGTDSSASYFDPNASLVIAYDQIAFVATGGVNISLSRIDTPFARLSSLIFTNNQVFPWGTAEPIASMSLSFIGPLSGLDSVALPEMISELLPGRISITSPDLVNTFPEPPRGDLIAGELDQRFKIPATPVPEPATVAMTGLGLLLVLGAIGHRRARVRRVSGRRRSPAAPPPPSPRCAA
jgi:hypothetical protein